MQWLIIYSSGDGACIGNTLVSGSQLCAGGTLHSAVMIYQHSEAQALDRVHRTQSLYAHGFSFFMETWSDQVNNPRYAKPVFGRDPGPGENVVTCSNQQPDEWGLIAGTPTYDGLRCSLATACLPELLAPGSVSYQCMQEEAHPALSGKGCLL